ncbi:uncharacterized protein METZ01_LOCUS294508 [marine metagenome]|uniref:Uncharacterized protein n=1 Tax=marine metagenome TaxID=408172 RepID=A0A382LY25_9ZZZZ
MKYLLVILFLFNSHLFAQTTNKDNESMMTGALKTVLDSMTDIYKSEKKSEDEEKKLIIKGLSESGGELTVEEVKQLQEIESEQSRKEDEQAMKDLSQMYDPETGMFSGMFKTLEKLNKGFEEKKDLQVKKLDKKIENIVDQIDKGEFKSAKLKIITLKWKPIGHKQIDTDMTKYYKEISQDLKDLAK